MRQRIVYTRHDGGVNVCYPSGNALRWMANGGRWADRERGFIDVQVARQVESGIPERAAVRFARAMQYGGCTAAEALGIIRDRDCHDGVAHELCDFGALPARWFRDAWRRGHNGGPITIDLNKGRFIQFRRIKDAADSEAARRAADISQFDRPIELSWGAIRDKLHAATDESDLRRVWPEELGNQI